MQLPANNYLIRVKEVEAGGGDLRPGMLLVMDPRGEAITLPGEPTTEPTFGLPAMWVGETHREEASFRGYTVVDPSTVITTHLTEVIKDNMAELLSYAETQKLLDDLPKEDQKLIADLVPSQISVGAVQRILQNLLAERISIRDLPTILEGVAEAAGYTRNLTMITEHVRAPSTPDQQQQHHAGRLYPARDLVAPVGAHVRRIDRRPGRRSPALDGAEQAAGVHHRGPPDL